MKIQVVNVTDLVDWRYNQMKIQVVNVTDLVDWIYQQPKDKQVRMLENRAKDQCGCLMVQYGLEKGLTFVDCGPSTWNTGYSGITAKLVKGKENFNVFYLLTRAANGFGRAAFEGTFADLIHRLNPEFKRQ